jgi:3-methyl-2-oxobutanoate hydroxymethyltransferase
MSLIQLRSVERAVNARKTTPQSLLEQKRSQSPITALTAYDYATARLVDEAGIDVVLVGDSLGMAVLGYESTLPVTMEEMLHHTRAVRRAVQGALLVSDMPYGSYHLGTEDAVRNAMRFVKEAGAEAVKIEGGAERVHLVAAMTAAEIPVVGHIGLTPQSVHRMGGYKVQGRTLAAIDKLCEDALLLQQAGAIAIVLEGVPREVAARITASLEIPTIGIGAGPECDGQILVFHDLFQLTFNHTPKFVRSFGDAGELFRGGLEAYREAVTAKTFPNDEESYHLSHDVLLDLNESELTPAKGR